MQSLLGGADCSTSSNPLKQFAQREAVDNSLFRDRHAGPSSSQRPFGAFQPATNGPQITGRPQQVPQPFNLSHLSSALSSTEVTSGPPLAQQFRPQWNDSQAVSRNGSPFTDEFAQHQNRPNQTQPQRQAPARMHSPSSDWASSFAPSKGKMRESPLMPTSAPQYPQDQYSSAYQPRMNNYSSFTPMYSGYNAQMSQPQAQLGPQQRSVEEQKAMEDAFEKALEDARAQTTSEKVQEDVEQKEEAKEEQVDESDGTYTAEGEFEKVWQSLRPEAERLGKLAEWEKDFSQFVNEEDDLYDILNESLNREDLGQTSLEDQMEFGTGQNWQDGMRDEEVVKPKEYDFTFPNQFDQIQKPIQAYWQANGILQAGGSLTSASLLVESFIRRISAAELADANLTEVDAWSMLGRIHAMNEKEEKALSAFEEGRKLLEAKPEETNGAGEMLTNLAISYVNESQDLAALNTLHQFLSLVHPKHAGLAPSQARLSGGNSPWALHQQLTDSYLSLAKEQYGQNGTVDPDVQVGLGTLYYTMGEYDQARDCWAAALGEKPGDYLLWNRLGATLANSGNSEEAVDAYRRALELKPTYTRAIFNLGVACLNIGVHREAAEHFLAALSLHARSAEGTDLDDGKDSLTLWMTLRRALTSLDLRDLAEKATPGTDLAVFRAAGFDF